MLNYTRLQSRHTPMSYNFVERPADIKEMEDYLLHDTQSLSTCKIFILYGMGGIGKTQLAAYFSQAYQSRFSSVIWLDARSEPGLQRSLATYGVEIWGTAQNKTPEPSFSAQIELALNWLRDTMSGKKLVVFDDVGGGYGAHCDIGYVHKYLPGRNCSVIMTTRLVYLRQLGRSQKIVKSDAGLSLAIFERWRGARCEVSSHTPLIQILDGLPLALVQAACYMRETNCTIQSYISMFTQDWDDLMMQCRPSVILDYGLRSVSTTWIGTLEAVKAEDKDAERLLLLWSHLDHTELWYPMLQSAVGRGQLSFPDWFRCLTSNEGRFLRAMKSITSHSLADINEDGSYYMHPVVHRWIAHLSNQPIAHEYSRLATLVVANAIPLNTVEGFWVIQQRLLRHADTAYSWLKNLPVEAFTDTLILEAATMLGDLYSDQGQYQRAHSLYVLTLDSCGTDLESQNIFVLCVKKSLGNVHTRLGQTETAQKIYKEVLERCDWWMSGRQNLRNPELSDWIDTLVLDTVNECANFYVEQELFQEAESLFEKVLEGKKSLYGHEHPSTLSTINNIGSLYACQRDYSAAEDQFKLALDGQIKTLGPYHPFTLSIFNNIGLLYADQNRIHEGEELCRLALTGYENTLGPRHPLTLSIICNIGNLLRMRGLYKDAIAMYLQVLDTSSELIPDIKHLHDRALRELGSLHVQKPDAEMADHSHQVSFIGANDPESSQQVTDWVSSDFDLEATLSPTTAPQLFPCSCCFE